MNPALVELTVQRCWCTYLLPSFASLHGSGSDISTGNSLISQLNQLLVVVISRFSVAFVKFPVLSPSVNSIVPATCDMLKYAMIGPFCPSTPKNKQYHHVHAYFAMPVHALSKKIFSMQGAPQIFPYSLMGMFGFCSQSLSDIYCLSEIAFQLLHKYCCCQMYTNAR